MNSANGKININNNCETCAKIVCKGCGWIAGDADIAKIRCGELTSCPICEWKPGDR